MEAWGRHLWQLTVGRRPLGGGGGGGGAGVVGVPGPAESPPPVPPPFVGPVPALGGRGREPAPQIRTIVSQCKSASAPGISYAFWAKVTIPPRVGGGGGISKGGGFQRGGGGMWPPCFWFPARLPGQMVPPQRLGGVFLGAFLTSLPPPQPVLRPVLAAPPNGPSLPFLRTSNPPPSVPHPIRWGSGPWPLASMHRPVVPATALGNGR